ncbi:MAG: phosphatidylglycerophosphatase A [Candidatus Brocadiaceae bacterium]|nr:phosphatidylglycerophosphatase A [Candidatus Brocadiaceae bacterium]
MKKQRDYSSWILATWFGAGFLPKAPGTWGSLAAFPFAYVISTYGGPYALIIGAVALFLIGMWASNKVEKNARKKDPGFIVVDEVVGQWIALFPLSFLYNFLSPAFFCFFSASVTVVAFIAFRIFDIWKPWPIRRVEKNIPGGLGIMLDDVIAGIYALIITSALSAGILFVSL